MIPSTRFIARLVLLCAIAATVVFATAGSHDTNPAPALPIQPANSPAGSTSLVKSSQISSPTTQPEAVSEPTLRIISSSPRALRIELQYPAPVVDSFASGKIVSIPGLPIDRLPQGYYIPADVRELVWLASAPACRVVDIETKRIAVGSLAKLDPKTAGDSTSAPLTADVAGYQPTQFAEVHATGKYLGIPMAAVTIHPVRYDHERGEVLAIQRIVIEVTGTSSLAMPTGRALSTFERTSLSKRLGALASLLPATLTTGMQPTPTTDLFDNVDHLRFDLKAPGLYRITGRQLEANGVRLSDIDPMRIKLVSQGRTIPIRVEGDEDGHFDRDDAFEFFGRSPMAEDTLQAPDLSGNRYSEYASYLLSWNGTGGFRLPEISGEIRETQRQYTASRGVVRAHFEQNNYLASQAYVATEWTDRWVWDSGIYNFEIRDYPFFLPYPDTLSFAPIKVRAGLVGLSYASPSGLVVHHAYLLINGSSDNALEAGRNSAGQFNWSGQSPIIIQTPSASGILNNQLYNGGNRLSVFSPGDAPGSSAPNRLALNWFQLEYLALPIAYEDQLNFGTPPENERRADSTVFDFTFTNFSTPDISVYRKNSACIINTVVERYTDVRRQFRYSVHFQDQPNQATEYYAIANSRKLFVPDSMMQFIPRDSLLTPPGGGAEYLVIGTRELLQSNNLNRVLALRAGTFSNVWKVDVEQIMARFGDGMFHPKAIREFLRYAVRNWSIPPAQITLLGDALLNQNQSPRRGGAMIPHPLMPNPEIGLVGSDTWYTLMDDNDYYPDIVVARVPARTIQEADDYYAKVLELENDHSAERWKATFTYINGQGGSGYFEIFNTQHHAAQGLRWFDSQNLQVWDERRTRGNTSDLQNLFANGSSLVIYNGHGGGGIWADGGGLFRTADIREMRNRGKYPLICNFSCFIVSFNGAAQRATMGEEFLLRAEKGAGAIFGSAGLGYLEQGLIYQQIMFENIARHAGISYGDLLTSSKVQFLGLNRGILAYGSISSTFWTTSLLGDPALRFPDFPVAPQTSATSIVQTGDSIRFTATLPSEISSGTATVRWYKADQTALESPIWYPVETTLPINSSNFTGSVRVPTGINSRNGDFRVFYRSSNGLAAARGMNQFYIRSQVSSGYVDSTSVSPNPLLGDSLFKVQAKIVEADGIRSATAIISRYIIVPNDSLLRTDTVAMVRVTARGQHWFETPMQTGLPAGQRIKFRLRWVDSLGNAGNNNLLYEYQVETPLPNLVWAIDVPRLTVTDSLMLTVNLYNNSPGHVATPSVVVQAIIQSSIYDTVEVQRLTIPSLAYAELYPVKFPFHHPPGFYLTKFRIDPDSLIQESNESERDNYYSGSINNTYWWATNAAGTGPNWYEPNPRLRMRVPPGSISGTSAILQVSYTDTLQTSGQQELKFAIGGRLPGQGKGFVLSQPDTGSRIQRIIVELSPDSTIGDRMVVHGRRYGDYWRMLTTQFDSGSAGVIRRYDGPIWQQIALLQNSDRTPPSVSFNAEGQIFTEDGYVRGGARFSAMVFDGGGLDLSQPNAVMCVVDNDTLLSSELLLPSETPAQSSQPVTMIRRFNTGRHQVKLYIRDLAGNRGADSSFFRVANDFKLEWLGNFPNPFTSTTTFFYSLTDQTTAPVKFEIFTVSGRKIRTLSERSTAVINYREIPWDGRDESGAKVANGVYFYKFTAKSGDRTIERRGKLAKLR